MKLLLSVVITGIFCCFAVTSGNAQSNFSAEEYGSFLESNRNLTGEQALTLHAPYNTYYKDIDNGMSQPEPAYLDSVTIKFELTGPELELLSNNHFVVTERVASNFAYMLHNIYHKDLPVFLSTDAVLHALHASYDHILMDLEREILVPNLAEFLDALYNNYRQLLDKYKSNEAMQKSLGDVDLYITTAKSLLADAKLSPQYISEEEFSTVWDAVISEKMTFMPLFSERERKLDFSQFTVRGHYTDDDWGKPLGPYFRCMMWLGRIDFLLTPPPDFGSMAWEKEDLLRMNLDALLLNELIEISLARYLLDKNDEIITFMVGESDNLTPSELAEIVGSQGISRADDILDDTKFDALMRALEESADSGQRILSNFFIMNPFSDKPDKLPISYRLMGQRFILDSYIFSNVVYDRIINDGKKIWRPMPDPLDALFVLGNDDALPLLQEELETYKYSSQLTSLRYLVDSYDDAFWEKSLYNTWLQAIRRLNPPEDRTGFPYFMLTGAWQQEKLNTQLASWAQLRHDNLLYAKQSYTGGTVCSFPHSFIEPYPAFYRQIGAFADKADAYFSTIPSNSWIIQNITRYFERLKEVVDKLEVLSHKELDGQAFTTDEEEFLQKMLFQEGGSGAPPFSGWYADLFYIIEDAVKLDFVVADVHTQPTDEFGSVVGKVLHVGVGKVNLGVFIADSPSNDFQPMAFVGPVMSYYEQTTNNFDRLTDERWTKLVTSDDIPPRPDWVNVYLADQKGNACTDGRKLLSVPYTSTAVQDETPPEEFRILQNYPNPFNPSTTLFYNLTQAGNVNLTIYDSIGQKIATLVDAARPAGLHTVQWNAGEVSSGIYFCRIRTGASEQTIKMLLMR